jgi:Ca2+:H+ antiporter
MGEMLNRLIFPRWDVITIILSIFLLTYTYIEARSNYHRGSILILRYVELSGFVELNTYVFWCLSYMVLVAGFYFAPSPTEPDEQNDIMGTFREVVATSALSWKQYAQVWVQSLWIR